MSIDVWAPRNDHPGRKSAPAMAHPNEVAISNPPGCRGLRNPPEEVAVKNHSEQVKAKAWKINDEERRKLRRMMKALR